MKNKTPKKKVVGIILTYNCASLIEKAYKNIPIKSFSSIIVVDDASTDNTVKVSRGLGLTTYTHKHMGYGGNLKFGLKKAYEMGADYMVEIHGDGQFDSSISEVALKKIEKGYDLLLGSRFIDARQPLRDKMPYSRYIPNIITSFVARTVFRNSLTEVHNGFHIFSKEFISKAGFANTSQGHIYSFEILAQASYKKLKVCEVPIRCNYADGHTSMDFIEAIPYIWNIFSILFLYVLAKAGLKYGLYKGY